MQYIKRESAYDHQRRKVTIHRYFFNKLYYARLFCEISVYIDNLFVTFLPPMDVFYTHINSFLLFQKCLSRLLVEFSINVFKKIKKLTK